MLLNGLELVIAAGRVGVGRWCWRGGGYNVGTLRGSLLTFGHVYLRRREEFGSHVLCTNKLKITLFIVIIHQFWPLQNFKIV